MSEEELTHSPRGFSKIDLDLIRQLNEKSGLGIQGARNITESRHIARKAPEMQKVKNKQDVLFVEAKEAKIGDEQGVFLSAKDGEINVSKIIDSFKGTKTYQRTPRILAFQRNVDPETVKKVLSKAKELIDNTNDKDDRIDTFSVLNIPLEEYERLAIKGELEKQVSKKLDQIYGADKLSNKLPKVIAECKQPLAIAKDPDTNEEMYNYGDSGACNIIKSVLDVKVKSPLLLRKNIREQFKEGGKYVGKEEIFRRLNAMGITTDTILNSLNNDSGTKKKFTKDEIIRASSGKPEKGDRKITTNKLLSLALQEMEDVEFSDLKIEVNYDYDKNNPDTIDNKKSNDGADKGNFFITGNYKVAGEVFKINKPILFHSVSGVDPSDWSKVEKAKSVADKTDIEKRLLLSLKKNEEIVNLISKMQPDTPNNMFSNVDGTSYGDMYKGETTTKMNKALPSPPDIPDEIKKFLTEHDDEINANPNLKNKFKDWRRKDFEFRRDLVIAETHRCPSGSVEVKRFPTKSEGMTPPQLKCDFNPLMKDDKPVVDKEGHIVGTGTLAERQKQYESAKTKGDVALKELFEGEFGKIVGCYDEKEKQLVMDAKSKARNLNDDLANFNNNFDIQTDELEKIESNFIKNAGFRKGDLKRIAKTNIQFQLQQLKTELDKLSGSKEKNPTLETEIKKKMDVIQNYAVNIGLDPKTVDNFMSDEKFRKDFLRDLTKNKLFKEKAQARVVSNTAYKVPLRFPVRTTGEDSYCKSIKNAKPNVHWNPDIGAIESEEGEKKAKRKKDVNIITKRRKKEAVFIDEAKD